MYVHWRSSRQLRLWFYVLDGMTVLDSEPVDLWRNDRPVAARVRINAGLTLLALGVYTQLALVLKKKQFEPKLVGAATPYLPVKYALTAPWMHWRLDRRVLTV